MLNALLHRTFGTITRTEESEKRQEPWYMIFEPRKEIYVKVDIFHSI